MTLGAVTENIYTCNVDNYLLSVVMVELLLMVSLVTIPIIVFHIRLFLSNILLLLSSAGLHCQQCPVSPSRGYSRLYSVDPKPDAWALFSSLSADRHKKAGGSVQQAEVTTEGSALHR